jgi:signal transduction histidine kinase
MSSRYSALMTGTHAKIRAGKADCSGVGDSDRWSARRDSGTTRTALPLSIRLPGDGKSDLEQEIRLQERCTERARIQRELHDTLFQGFLGASMLLDVAVEHMSRDSPSLPALVRARRLVIQAIEEGRATLRGLRAASPALSTLEQAFSNFLGEVTTENSPQLRILVHGKPRTLSQGIQAQLFLIGREAIMNALRHSGAKKVEVELEYRSMVLRVSVRDNGRGINPEAVRRESNSHWGLCGMRERAETIGARFSIWSRVGAGTEVNVIAPVNIAKMTSIDTKV